jgi:UDP-N-acetylglucosamine--N-acetylmuramyl-(pentapeptide) pyrophosphoryl-undecaprenol N-acetylglucosamine transferase
VKTIFDLPRAIWESRRIFSEFRPNVVVGVGGYASGPAMLTAILRGVPTLAFEPNVVPGFANRMVARYVSDAAVHFAETAKYFRQCRVTGVPVRQAFFDVTNTRAAGSNPTLLVFGGSQGAHAINRAILDSVALLRQRIPRLHIIHQTGERDYNDARAAYAKTAVEAEVHAFIDDMPAFFGRADLLLCRAGAGTVAEVAAAAKPAILVPFPRAADDHQKRNAEAFDRAGAAIMIEESKLDVKTLVETVSSLINNRSCLAKMGDAARSLAHPDAARDIGRIVARLAGAADTQFAEKAL